MQVFERCDRSIHRQLRMASTSTSYLQRATRCCSSHLPTRLKQGAELGTVCSFLSFHGAELCVVTRFGTWIESDGNTKPMRGDDDDDDDNLVYQSVPGPCCNDSCENPHGLNVRASFVAPSKNFQLFQPRYQRNNKKGGQKNLRCFPCCRNGRHVSSGFCGDSIRVHVAVSRTTESGGVKICPIQTTRPAVLAFARFLNLEGTFDMSVSGPEVFPGQTIDKTDVLAWVRDKEHPLNPLFPGILRGAAMETSTQSTIFEFNAECKAWHYGWTAPRGQGLSGSDAQHVLEILFMKPMGSYMYCLERLRSDPFSIYSSRRASNATIKPEATPFESDLGAERGIVKRKRAQVHEYSPRQPLLIPSSPAPTISSVSSSSPGVSPSKDAQAWNRRPNGGVYLPPATTPANGTVQRGNASPVFKVENSGLVPSTSLSSSMTMSATASCPTGTCTDPPTGISALGFDNQGLSMFMNMGLQQDPVQDQLQQLVQQQALMEQLAQNVGANQPGDLMSHSLFADDLPARRVISSEELPWSELYNLFDTVPLPMPMDDDPDDDMDSNPSSAGTPTPDQDTSSVDIHLNDEPAATAIAASPSLVPAGAPTSSAMRYL